jgi:hypothetical protein
VGLTLFSGLAFAAEQRSANDIINALKSPRVRNRPTRSLSTEERDKIASIASSKPKIDLEINFEYNSAVIGSKAMPQVTELGKARFSKAPSWAWTNGRRSVETAVHTYLVSLQNRMRR